MLAFFAGVGVVASTLVIFAYLIFIWWLDRYEREPLWLVFLTFLYGGIFGIACGCGISFIPAVLLTLLGPAGDFVSAVVVAPLVEEFTKGFVFVFLLWSRNFDNETDGLIYGAATGLGFAFVENLMYFSGAANAEELLMLVFIRTMFTALVHCISSATLGMAFGRMRRVGGAGGVVIVIVGYLLACLNHAVWNGLASAAGLGASAEVTVAMLLVGCSLVAIASVIMFGLTQISLTTEHRFIRTQLEREAKLGTLPIEHAAVVPYWLKRRKSGWLPAGVDRKAYVRAATLLAFRQHQLTTAGSERAARLVDEIETLRQQVQDLLGGSP